MPTQEINGEVVLDWDYQSLEVTDSEGTVSFETREEMDAYLEKEYGITDE